MSFRLTEQLRKQSSSLAKRYAVGREQREDIESECMIAAWKAERRLDEQLDPDAYVYRAMKNSAVDSWRGNKRVRERPGLPRAYESYAPDHESLGAFQLREFEMLLEALMDRVDDRDRAILRILAEGGTDDEVAEFLKIKPNHARSILHSRRKAWKKLLKEL